MVNVLLFSNIETSGFSPKLTVLLVLRAIFGIAMGGEWGVGASLTMSKPRGWYLVPPASALGQTRRLPRFRHLLPGDAGGTDHTVRRWRPALPSLSAG